MSISSCDQTIAPMIRMLSNLDTIVSTAEAHARAEDIDPSVLIQARPHPNMLPFVYQVRIATDTAKGASARVSGCELPKWADDEQCFDDVHARLGKAIGCLKRFKPQQFDSTETKA